MKNLNALVALCVFSLSTAALAEDKKAEAQAKVDAAMAQSCELTKKNILGKKDVCAEEAATLEATDCNDKEARKKADFLKLNGTCLEKQKAAIKGGAAKKEDDKTAAAPATDEKKKGTHCKALDETGAVQLEHDSEGSSIKCQTELREKVKAEKCEPGKKLEWKFVGESMGKEMKPTSLTITCPKARSSHQPRRHSRGTASIEARRSSCSSSASAALSSTRCWAICTRSWSCSGLTWQRANSRFVPVPSGPKPVAGVAGTTVTAPPVTTVAGC